MNTGDRVFSYIVERELGEGGMGTVYLGRHTVLNQQVAIKVLSPLLARDHDLRERFIQEANIQAGLRHHGIVQVLTAEMEGEQPLLIMEYIEGRSLSEVLDLRGALPVDDALKIMEQVLSAVGYAHRQNVIHRDLKPSNVMVLANGEAKVTDFGIAKVLGSAKLTRTGTAMGSAHYMSPEQIRRPESVDARSDIYSLGCVFYEILTGHPPFGEKDASGTESDFEIKIAHVNEAAPEISRFSKNIPLWVDQLVLLMLEKDVNQRPSSCEEVLEKIKAGIGPEIVKIDDKTVVIAPATESEVNRDTHTESEADGATTSQSAPSHLLKTAIKSDTSKLASSPTAPDIKFLLILSIFVVCALMLFLSGSYKSKEEAPPPPAPDVSQTQSAENDTTLLRCEQLKDRWLAKQQEAFDECSGRNKSGPGDGPRCRARTNQSEEIKSEMDSVCSMVRSQ